MRVAYIKVVIHFTIFLLNMVLTLENLLTALQLDVIEIFEVGLIMFLYFFDLVNFVFGWD